MEQLTKAPKKTRWKKILLITLAVIVLLHLVLVIAIPPIMMKDMVGMRIPQHQYTPEEMNATAERMTLETEDDLKLAAWRMSAEEPKGTVIILSGIQNPSVTAFFGYGKMFADAGWNSLLIEMRARSDSEGEETGLGMTEWLDVKAGVEFLQADAAAGDLPIVAMGTSMGAGTLLIAGGEIPEIDAVISLSGFSSWPDVFVGNMRLMGVPEYICVLQKPFVSLYMGLHYSFDLLGYTPLNGIAKMGDRPVLLMQSTGDTQVPYDSYEKLLAKAEEQDVTVTSFIREGDEHFICYSDLIMTPTEDEEFSAALLEFLSDNFD